jgi:hypothetical protein
MDGPEGACAAVREINNELKFAIAGLTAVLLGRRASRWGASFCRDALYQIAFDMLELQHAEFEALLPLSQTMTPFKREAPCSRDGWEATNAFIQLLPTRQHPLILRGLLAMMAGGFGMTNEALSRFTWRGTYDARFRELLGDVSAALELPGSSLAECETALGNDMQEALASSVLQPAQAQPLCHKKAGLDEGTMRGLAVASVGVVGGVAVAVSAGFAAPAVVSGIAALGGGITGMGGTAIAAGTSLSATAAMLSGTAGVAAISSVFGMTGAGLAGLKMHRRLGKLKEFSFAQSTSRSDASLAVCICISGWISGEEDDPALHWWGESRMEKTLATTKDKELERGSQAWYTRRDADRKEERVLVTVADVHYDDLPPYYAVVLDGVERETVRERLEPIGDGAAGVEHSDEDSGDESSSEPDANAGTGADRELCDDTSLATSDVEDPAAWLMSMGFPARAAQRASTQSDTLESMVELLLKWGIRPSQRMRAEAVINRMDLDELKQMLRQMGFRVRSTWSVAELRIFAVDALLHDVGGADEETNPTEVQDPVESLLALGFPTIAAKKVRADVLLYARANTAHVWDTKQNPPRTHICILKVCICMLHMYMSDIHMHSRIRRPRAGVIAMRICCSC